MKVTSTNQPLSMLTIALHKLLNIAPSSKDTFHVWTQQELLNICLSSRKKSGKKRSKVQELLERLVKKKLIHSVKIRTDNEKCEVVIYWIPPPLEKKNPESVVQGMDVDQKQIVEKVEPRTPEPQAKRISLGPKTPNQSMASIISKTRAKFSGSTPTSTPTGRSFQTPFGRRTPLSSSSKKPGRQTFKSPLVQVSKSPEIKALIEQRRQLERDIETSENNIRKIKLLTKYQEKDEDANNENLIKIWRKASQEAAEFLFSKLPKQSSFLGSGGFSESWGNSSWGWVDSDELESKKIDKYSDQEDHEEEYETRGNTEQKDTMRYMLTKMGIDVDLIRWNEDDECFEE